jgi:hypothetical protein
MHQKFVAWFSQSWGRAAFCTALFGVLSLFGLLPFMLVAGALPVFVTLHTDARQGVRTALIGTVAISGLVLVLDGSVLKAVGSVATIYWMPFALGVLLKRYRSLTLTFQVAVLISLVGIGASYLVLADPDGLWNERIRKLLLAMQEGFGLDDKQIGTLQTLLNWGTFVTQLLLTGLGSLFLGRWWQSLIDAPKQFGAEFRQLRLGRYLGVTAVLIVVVASLSSVFGITLPVVDAWLWIAVVALAIQGLAVAHARKASGKLASGWLTAIYICLVLPITVTMVVAVLVGLGLADNWRQYRATSS